MRLPSIRVALLAALGVGLSAAAQAETVNFEALRHMAPSRVHAWAMQQIKRQQSTQAARALAGLDVTPPVLTAFDVSSSIDVSLADNPLLVSIKASDDRSGITNILAFAQGPSGQIVGANLYSGLPSKKVAGNMLGTGLTSFQEPGTYTFYSAYVSDAAGNVAQLDQGALAALGRSSFTVKNKRGFDTLAPTLDSGKILTPVLSRSATHPGTDQPPYAGISVSMTDGGETAVSGVPGLSAIFCTIDQSNCFYMWGNDNHVPGTPSVTVQMGAQLSPDTEPGVYHIHSLSVGDRAFNIKELLSTEFSGTTDFSAYFPSTTITINP
jgi:hypothetical protein